MTQPSRRKKLALNTISAIIKQVVTLICGFILPRYILEYYGSTTNGLITSITQFLSFIAFLEMGIGPVIQSNLYLPLAKKNTIEISKIVVASEKFFKRIAYIFLIYILVLVFIFPNISKSAFSYIFTDSLLVIISISTFAQYYFGITYQLLLNADQKSYVQLSLQAITILINTIFSVIMIKMGASIQVVKLMTAMIYLVRPFGQMVYVRKHYNIQKHITYDEEPIKQKWNGFVQHIAAVVVANTDIAILSVFNTLENVSIYSVYFNVVNGVNTMVMTLATGLESLWGNMLANNEQKRLKESFEAVELLSHGLCTTLFTITGILIVPFVKVYTNGINDTDYIKPVFAILLVIAYGLQCMRIPYFRIIKAAGHYKQTQMGSLIQVVINITLSIAFVFRFGINGVAVGTLIAMGYHTCYFVWYLKKNILFRNITFFVRHVIVDTVCVLVSVAISSCFSLEALSYRSWIFLALYVAFTVIIVNIVLQSICYYQDVKKWIMALRR